MSKQEMPEDLFLLATDNTEWRNLQGADAGTKVKWNDALSGPEFFSVAYFPDKKGYWHHEILQARRELGLVTTEAEDEAFEAMQPKRSKYHVEIRPGVWVDVYDVLKAYTVTNPADAHAIKKMLCPGKRGVKSANQDRREAIVSLERAIELEGGE